MLSFVYCAKERVRRDESEYDLIYVSDYDGELAIPRERVRKWTELVWMLVKKDLSLY